MNQREVKKQAAQIFLDAAVYIRKYGWQVTGMGRHGQPRCSMGALASVWPEQTNDKNLSSLMYSTLYSELGGMTLTQFNYKFNDGKKVAHLYEQVATSLLK
jgi:hypothetical protein